MQKLTVEQRDWLIKEFHKTDYRDWEEPDEWVQEILNQCTEDESKRCLGDLPESYWDQL